MRNLLHPLQDLNLVHGSQTRRQPAVNAKHLAVDESCEVQVVKHLDAVLPGVGIAVLANALFVKPIHLCYLPRLVVSAKQRYAVGIPCLETQQELKCFHAIVSPIYKVTHENVIGAGQFAPCPKQFEQVKKLAVNVAANLLLGFKGWVGG